MVHISERMLRVIKVIVVVIVIIAILILIASEMDRKRPRKVPVPCSMYYGSGFWITAPFNLLTAWSVKDERDLDPFPTMKHNFPGHEHLRENWQKIRDEVLTVYENEGMSKIKDDMFFQKIADDKWKKFYIKWYGDSLRDANEKMPFTTKLIDSFPEIKCAMISVLEPGSVITPHVGPNKSSLRYHLGLQTPNDKNGCWIKVDGEKYSWKDGEDVLFDDTFVHEVQNKTNEKRIILFCDVQRDLNNGFSNAVGDFVSSVAKVTSRGNK